MSSARYRSAGAGHVMMNRSRNGDRVLLEDRSLWRVDPSEMARASRWPQWTKVRVQEAPGTAYWLSVEVLGRKERVLAVFAGYVAVTSPSAAAGASAAASASTPEF
jgi:hypothetical protein